MNGSVPNRQSGFTLIELLVVMAIISLLVSILLPSLTKARDLARQTVCFSNLKHIGLAVMLYVDEYDGYIVPPQYPSVVNPVWFANPAILSYLQMEGVTSAGLVAEGGIYDCPSSEYGYYMKNYNWGPGFDYAMNNIFGIYNVAMSNQRRRIDYWSNPNELRLIGDSNEYCINLDNTNYINFFHDGKADMVFLDMHVGCVTEP